MKASEVRAGMKVRVSDWEGAIVYTVTKVVENLAWLEYPTKGALRMVNAGIIDVSVLIPATGADIAAGGK